MIHLHTRWTFFFLIFVLLVHYHNCLSILSLCHEELHFIEDLRLNFYGFICLSSSTIKFAASFDFSDKFSMIYNGFCEVDLSRFIMWWSLFLFSQFKAFLAPLFKEKVSTVECAQTHKRNLTGRRKNSQ